MSWYQLDDVSDHKSFNMSDDTCFTRIVILLNLSNRGQNVYFIFYSRNFSLGFLHWYFKMLSVLRTKEH
jgi:hypothetical protein